MNDFLAMHPKERALEMVHERSLVLRDESGVVYDRARVYAERLKL
jgi:hypothetical protein